jgi:phospholipase/lecithinase/hemolysin
MTVHFSTARLALCGVCLLAGSLLLTACSDESLLSSEATNDTFARYVALGNSITAGFQSNGIVDSTQSASYAALLAEQMNTRFDIPALREPGCPPPVRNVFTSALDGRTGPACSLRRASPPPTVLNNVAVPGAKVIDALRNDAPTSSPNELTTFILGGRTQVEAARQLNPTFASVWLGNNDALDAALSGNPDALTDASTFESQITRVVDSLVDAGADRGILVGVANPTLIPHLSPGQAYAAAESQINQFGQTLAGQNPQFSWGGYTVDASCANAGADTRIPFVYGFQSLFFQALQGQSVQLNCAPASAPDPLLTPSEQSTIVSRVQSYNATLSALADENGWAYLDINPALQALYAANASDMDPSDDLVPKFPRPPTNLQAPADNPPTFGRYFSEDGVHPSTTAHRVVTYLIIQTLNNRYEDVQLDQVSIPDEAQSLL